MTLEPQDCKSVSIRAFPPKPPEVRSLQDYQASIAARFGGKLPSWQELARRENRAMLANLANSTMSRSQTGRANSLMPPRDPEAEQRRIDRLQDVLAEKAAATRSRILAVMTAPKTLDDISRGVGLSRNVVSKRLAQLLEDGKVTKTPLKRVAIWERADAAASGGAA